METIQATAPLKSAPDTLEILRDPKIFTVTQTPVKTSEKTPKEKNKQKVT